MMRVVPPIAASLSVVAHPVVEAAGLVSTCQSQNAEELGEAPVKYLVLIWSNPRSRAIWESFSDEQRSEGFRYYAALTEELAANGELIVSEALADASLTRRVSVRDGRTLTSDGPFAEAKELLAGFFLLEVPSEQRAVEIAARVPEAELGLVEVRPVLRLGGMEM
jgi:hypothetical protein